MSVTVKVLTDGPLIVTGECKVEDAQGNAITERKGRRFALPSAAAAPRPTSPSAMAGTRRSASKAKRRLNKAHLRHLAKTVGAPSAARSWQFELRGEATRRGLRQSYGFVCGINSALVSRRHTPSFNSNSGAPPRTWTFLSRLQNHR